MARTDVTAPSEAVNRPRVNVLGVGIDAVDMDRAIRFIDASIAAQTGGYVCVTGVHGVMEAQRDVELRRHLNRSLLTTPDGMPVVWVGWARRHRSMDRVYGPDLMLELCRRSAEHRYRHFLYGGLPGVADQLARCLTARFPDLDVVGTATPPFRELTSAEENDIIARFARVQPHIVWIGISTPKQERLMARLQARVAPAILIGVGAAFDIHSGRMPQAPRWMQRSGLEWVFRAASEPRRLIPRYALNNLPFVCRIALQQFGLGRYPLES
jgi:N-acetylglucosaminyldiphosphoundecaprenol N-acetyl-beta-D-mannosaminyltransferase